MSGRISPTREETSKSQGPRRNVEVPCSGVPLGSLAGFWDDCGLWEINSRVWKSKRTEETSTNVWDIAWLPIGSNLDVCSCSCDFMSPSEYDLIWHKIVDNLLMWLSMECDVNDGALLFSPWRHLACAYLLNQRMNGIEQVLLSWQYLQNFWEWIAARCAILIFKYFQTSTVTVAIWIPSSASTPQVGFMSMGTSSTWQERSKSQGQRRIKMEVPCSGVPFGSLARFWDGCRLWEINSGAWNGKELKKHSILRR